MGCADSKEKKDQPSKKKKGGKKKGGKSAGFDGVVPPGENSTRSRSDSEIGRKGKKKKDAISPQGRKDSQAVTNPFSPKEEIPSLPIKTPSTPPGLSGNILAGLSASEERERRKIAEHYARIIEMYGHDFVKQKPVSDKNMDDLFGDEEDFEGEERRCSMNNTVTKDAKKFGSEFVVPTKVVHGEDKVVENASDPHSRSNVAKHDKEDDLWVIIRNRIYDLTEFQASHPGGSWVLLQVAGKDATSTFEKQHSVSYLGAMKDFVVGEVPASERR